MGSAGAHSTGNGPRDVRFRPATTADVDAVASLHAESWRRAYRGVLSDTFLDGAVLDNRLAVWRDRLREARDDQFVCLAVTDRRLSGFVCAFGLDDPTWGSHVDNLHVAQRAQGRGLGTALLARAATWARTSYPSSGLYLWVFEDNHAARGFYERLGGAHVETAEKATPDGGRARARRYAWANLSKLAAM